MDSVEVKRIEEVCQRLLSGFCGKEALPYKKTKKGLWATSVTKDVYLAFRWASLEKYRQFVDLGSGDGRVVAIASLFTMAAGIEIDPELHWLSLQLKDALELDNVAFYLGDFQDFNLHQFDFIYMYPDRARINIESAIAGWRGVVMIAGHHFQPSGWQKIGEKKFSVEKFSLYSIG